jgi:heme exporter protein B
MTVRIFRAMLWRDMRLAWRTNGAGLALAFFVLVIVLLPLAAGTEPQLLRRVGPGLVWLAAVLAVLLTLERLFQVDLETAALDLFLASPASLEEIVVAKALAHWLMVGLPLTVLAVIATLLLGLPARACAVLIATLLVGTPGLTCTGSIAAALTAGIRRGSLLITLLVLPLYAPFVIFGAGAATLAAFPAPPLSPLPGVLLLGATSIIAMIGGVVFVARAVRSQLD